MKTAGSLLIDLDPFRPVLSLRSFALVRPQAKRGLKIKTNIKAGSPGVANHNETLVRA
jgi:hypothetical protein